MSKVYVLLYIHTDNVEFSEVLGVFNSKNDAINELLERANYREINGMLTQYMEPTTEYDSFSSLKNMIEEKMELHDVDIYRIEVCKLT